MYMDDDSAKSIIRISCFFYRKLSLVWVRSGCVYDGQKSIESTIAVRLVYANGDPPRYSQSYILRRVEL